MKRPNSLTGEQVGALCRFAEAHGRCWKDKLGSWWLKGYQAHPDGALLQQVRNTFGDLRFTTKDLWQWAEDAAYTQLAFDAYDSQEITIGGEGSEHPMVDIVEDGAWVQAWVWVPAPISGSEDEE